MNTEYLIYTSLGLSVLLILTVVWQGMRLKKLDQIRTQFFAAGIEKDLEQVLVDQNRAITKINQDLIRLNDNLTDLSILNKDNIQKIGFVRYNPFDDAGGNISFALALLNDHDDGVVISSLHGREGTRVYAKDIKKKKSSAKLTEEEKEALEKAK